VLSHLKLNNFETNANLHFARAGGRNSLLWRRMFQYAIDIPLKDVKKRFGMNIENKLNKLTAKFPGYLASHVDLFQSLFLPVVHM
jgi:hypothetical protein